MDLTRKSTINLERATSLDTSDKREQLANKIEKKV